MKTRKKTHINNSLYYLFSNTLKSIKDEKKNKASDSQKYVLLRKFVKTMFVCVCFSTEIKKIYI